MHTSPDELLHRLRERLDRAPRTRYAPSPSGHLHIGHVVNAVFVWGLARALGGSVILRIEDHDRERSRAGYEASILDDLEWLGLHPDEGDLATLRSGPSTWRQSDRLDRYAARAAELAGAGHLYWCGCSRADIASHADADAAGERCYGGRCRERGLDAAPDLALRLRVAPGTESFTDTLLGPQVQEPWQQCGDFAICDRRGNWTYQFAVVVDDLDQGVDLVVRGEDLLSSTGRQLVLARLLGGAAPPAFVHHPLLYGPSGAKLSKRDGAVGIRELRALGWTPARVLGHAAHRCGLTGLERPIAAEALAQLFAG